MHYRFVKAGAFSGEVTTSNGKLCLVPRWMERHNFTTVQDLINWLDMSGAYVTVAENERSKHRTRLL